ncbi:MAG: cellulose synthase subunit [Gemmataceae bacterium]|nr:cellulose synthase subunit [Gemmataceae bacterium]
MTGQPHGGSPVPTPPAVGARGTRGCVVVLTILAATGVGLGIWRWLSSPVPVDPPNPPDIADAEIRRAVDDARAAVTAAPRSADAWGRLGMVLLAHIYEREPDLCFAEATRLDPTDPRWPYGRAIIVLKRDPEAAISHLRQAAAGPPSQLRSTAKVQLAEVLLDRRELDEAEQLFREELRRSPGNARAVYGLGLVALARGDDAAAVAQFESARQSRYARKLAAIQLARLASVRGDRDSAARYEKEAAQLPLDPSWPDPFVDAVRGFRVGARARFEEADQLEQRERFAEAAELFLAEVRDRPTARAFVGAGINLLRVGRLDEAIPLLREGVGRDPTNAQAQYFLALALFTRAEVEYQHSPQSTREQFGEVRDHARRAAELKPDHARAYLFWGLSLKYLGEPAAAVEPLRKGVACRPEEFELQLALGEALLVAGQAKEAENHLENARLIDPKDPRPARAIERLRPRKE